MIPNEMIFAPVNPPTPQNVERKHSTSCRACRSANRDAVEAILLSGISILRAEKEVQRVCGESLPYSTLRNHLQNHMPSEAAQRMNVVLGMAESFGLDVETANMATPELFIESLMFEAFGKMIRGDIRVSSLNDALKVFDRSQMAKMNTHKRTMDERRAEIESGTSEHSAGDLFRQLGYIMEALKVKVPQELLHEAVKEAWSRGLNKEIFDLSEVYDMRRESDYVEVDLSEGAASVRDKLAQRKSLPASPSQEVAVDSDVPPED